MHILQSIGLLIFAAFKALVIVFAVILRIAWKILIITLIITLTIITLGFFSSTLYS